MDLGRKSRIQRLTGGAQKSKAEDRVRAVEGYLFCKLELKQRQAQIIEREEAGKDASSLRQSARILEQELQTYSYILESSPDGE